MSKTLIGGLIIGAALVSALLFAPIGCDGKDEPTRETPPAVPAFDTTPPPHDPGPRPRKLPSDSPDQDTPPRFTGLSQLIAGDGAITLRWEPALDTRTPRDRIRYAVYISRERQDEAKYSRPPHLVTPAGHTGVRIDGLTNGEAVYVVVRARDANGNEDDNELEWSGIPNRVLYVQAGAAPGGDGLSPANPLPDLASAISASISWIEGANIYMAEGEYSEPTTLLFEGVMVYGGFARGFRLPINEPRTHPTVIRHANPVTLSEGSLSQFILAQGDLVCGIDGLELHGEAQVPRGVTGEDCEFRISNSTIHAYLQKGIYLKSETKADSVVIGEISRCWVYDTSNGRGIHLFGILDIAITGCGIYRNHRHGIDIEGLTATPEEKSRITIEGCRIYENEDIGIGVKARALPEDRSHDSRIRIKVRSCEIANNADSGISIDVAFADGIDLNLRVRLEQCRIEGNGRRPTEAELTLLADASVPTSEKPRLDFSGIHIDGDARGHYQLTRNQILGNRGHGVHLTGDGPRTFYQIQSCAILANEKSGVQLDSGDHSSAEVCGHLSIDHCHIAGNGGFAFFGWGNETWMRVEDSMLHGNGAPAFADLLEYCIVGERQVTDAETIAPTPDEPWLPTLPRRILIEPDLRPGAPPDLSSIEVGTVVEWLDDGVPRTVELAEDGTKSLRATDPEAAPALAASTGVPFLYVWGMPSAERTPEALIVEDYRAPRDSVLITSGNPIERAVDPNWGGATPEGGFFGGYPGIDRGGAPPPRGLELSWVDPAPGMLIDELDFSLQFTGADSLPDEFKVVVRVGDEVIDRADLRLEKSSDDPTRLRVSSRRPLAAGDRVRLELLPWPARTGERQQALDHVFVFDAAAPLDLERGPQRLPAKSTLDFIGGKALRIPLDGLPEKRVVARLICESPAGELELVGDPFEDEPDDLERYPWRMAVIDRASGQPFLRDGDPSRPVRAVGKEPSDVDLHLAIPPLPPGGAFDLLIQPPRESLFDATARLTIAE